jgi:dihydroorotate dehydrogenase (NAD+) catalytic subunit
LARIGVTHEKGTFRTPIVLASGPAGFGIELARSLDFRGIGALTTKTVTFEPRDGNPQPRIVDAPAGAINSVGLENPGLEAFRSNVLPQIRSLPTARIVSLAGGSPDETATMARALQEDAGIDWLELNLSCPNVSGEMLANRPEQVGALVRATRDVSTRPLLVKLPSSNALIELADAAIAAGADGLTLINAVRGMRIHVETGRPYMARECGGLCGPAILPIALSSVFSVRRAFPDTFIVGTGGVDCVRAVVEMLCAGANLVGVGFALMVDPAAVFGWATELEEWLDERSIGSVTELVGAAQRGGWRVS